MFDLAIAPNGDLLFGGSRDLSGKSEKALYEQLITLRLRIRRGSWLYDVNGTLGSRIYEILNRPRPEAAEMIPVLVTEATRDIEAISIDDVIVESEGSIVFVRILYRIIVQNIPEQFQTKGVVTVPFPIGGE